MVRVSGGGGEHCTLFILQDSFLSLYHYTEGIQTFQFCRKPSHLCIYPDAPKVFKIYSTCDRMGRFKVDTRTSEIMTPL